MVHTTNLDKSWSIISPKKIIATIGGGPALIKERSNVFPKYIYVILDEESTFDRAFYFDKDKQKDLASSLINNDLWINSESFTLERVQVLYEGEVQEYIFKEDANNKIKIFIRHLSA